jgi:hypothetical protein
MLHAFPSNAVMETGAQRREVLSMRHRKESKMKHIVAVPVLILMVFAVGCAERNQVEVTFLSDPPGGTLYKPNGDPLGPCPKILWYDLDEEAVEKGHLDAKGMVVRWPSGPEKKSDDLIEITVNGTDRHVVFLQPTPEYAEDSR